MTEEPVRLRDAASDDVLRRDLGRARGDDAGYDVTAGLSRFEAAIAGGAPLPPEPAAAATSTSAIGWGVGTIFAVAVVAIAVTRPWADPPRAVASATLEDHDAKPSDAPTRVAAEAAPAVPEVPTASATAVPAAPSAATADTADRDAPRSAPARPSRARPIAAAVEPAREAPQAQPDQLEEMKATRAAASALASDPARALALVERADRDFAGGMFDEDRRGIAALAELQLGKSGAAAHAHAYLRAHPKGTYAERLRRALEPSPVGDAEN